MDRYVCIHGHFYQPPRENPWLEFVEVQDSAYPYHDWNERITRESYAPNSAARILDDAGRISKIVNNYARISFNFGPTLLSWLQENAADVYHRILEADRESLRRFFGHGSAIAQPYNHMILPLATRQDKATQILWGCLDFEHRFGRAPEGMWLPETAVDLESLALLADRGIRFTILGQHQARRVRPLGGSGWTDVSGGRVDPTRPYEVRLPSERKIAVFFYDDAISRAVAFEGLLNRGEDLAGRLSSAFLDSREWPQLVNIATDGETYGHHHRHGEMALSYALEYIETNGMGALTNYGAYLADHPPTHEVELLENTSWSCLHGIERWRGDCGCRTGSEPRWKQAWRGPVREALDWLRDTLNPRYETAARKLLKDPWRARDDYVSVVLDRSQENVDRFLRQHALKEPDDTARLDILRLLEMQRHLMLMYTSCGWFFNDVSGIETVQVLQYAGRAIQLAETIFQESLEPKFVERLAAAKSNILDQGDGAKVYERYVKSAMVDLEEVAAHYAVSSLFEAYPERAPVYCYLVDREDFEIFEAGRATLALGRARVTSRITSSSMRASFGVLHFGDHNISGGVRPVRGDEAYRELIKSMSEAFYRADFAEVIRLMDYHFGESTYSLKSLFRDEQRKILLRVLASTLTSAEETYRQLYQQHAPLMYFISNLNVPFPTEFRFAAEIVLNRDLREAFEQEEPDTRRIDRLLKEARAFRVAMDDAGLGHTLRGTIEKTADGARSRPGDVDALRRFETLVNLARSLPFDVDLWKVQNIYHDMLQTVYPEMKHRAPAASGDTEAWTAAFRRIGEELSVRVE